MIFPFFQPIFFSEGDNFRLRIFEGDKLFGGAPVKLFRPELAADAAAAEPGAVLQADPRDGLLVATAAGALRFGEVQPPGKRRMPSQEWIRGRGVKEGDRFH